MKVVLQFDRTKLGTFTGHVRVDAYAKVEHVLSLYSMHNNQVEPDKFRVYFKGAQLDDHKNLAAYGIQENDELVVRDKRAKGCCVLF